MSDMAMFTTDSRAERFLDSIGVKWKYSIEEASNLNHGYVGTEHILLGLLREPYGVGHHVLESLGITLPTARDACRKLFEESDCAALLAKCRQELKEQKRINADYSCMMDGMRYSIAMAALQGIIAREGGTPDANARFAIANADALLAALATTEMPPIARNLAP